MATEHGFDSEAMYATCPCCGRPPHYPQGASVGAIRAVLDDAKGGPCHVNFTCGRSGAEAGLLAEIRAAFPGYRVAPVAGGSETYFLMRPLPATA